MRTFKTLPLSGWDVAYAIGFSNVNEAIRHIKTEVPQKLEITESIKDEYIGEYIISIMADYDDWAMIGTHSGYQIGALVKLKKLTCDITFTTSKTLQSKEYKFKHSVGVPLSFKLSWYSKDDSKHELKRSTDIHDFVQINTESYIIHPDDPDLHEMSLFNPLIKAYIQKGIEKDVAEEFNHVFATVDYTEQAGEKAKWLKLTTHDYATSLQKKENNVPLLAHTRNNAERMLNNAPQALLTGPDKETALKNYEKLMDPEKGYSPGALIIIGMTEGRKPPPSIPSNLTNIIPEKCQAGYAYNDNLIIPHLLRGHLEQTFICSPEKDFDYVGGSKRKLKNIRKLSYIKEVVMDSFTWHNFIDFFPHIRPTIEEGGVIISLEDARIKYELHNLLFFVPQGNFGIGLPYDIDITQSYSLLFDYRLNKEKFAQITVADDDDATLITATVTPHVDDSGGGSWQTVKNFVFALGQNLAIMGLTLGCMKLGSLTFNGMKAARRSTIAWWRSRSAKAAGEKAVAIEGAESAAKIPDKMIAEAASKHAQNVEASAIATAEEETALVQDTKKGKQSFDKLNTSLVWELAKFAFWQTIVSKGWEALQNFFMSSFTNEAKRRGFVELVFNATSAISWGNQDDKSIFEVKTGELTDGSFSIGLDLKFKHEQKPGN